MSLEKRGTRQAVARLDSKGVLQATRTSDDISVPQLRAVVAVGRMGSFTAAGEVLGISQPAVSRAVASVEEILGVALLDRTTRAVSLTKAGEMFVKRATRALAEMDAAASAAREADDASGDTLTVACSVSVSNAYAATVLRLYEDQHENARIVLNEIHQTDIENDVASGRADIGIANMGNLHPTLASRELWTERYHLCVPAGHPLAGRTTVPLDEIHGEHFVMLPHQGRSRFGIDPVLAAIGRAHTPRIYVQQYSTAFQIVQQGLALHILPASAVLNAPAGLAFPLLGDKQMTRGVGVVWQSGHDLPEVAESFVETLVRVHANDKRRSDLPS